MWKLKIKMERKTENRMQEVSADEIGRKIQAYSLCCGISPTGSNSTKGEKGNRRKVEVLEEIH